MTRPTTRLGVVLRPQIAPEALRDAVVRCEQAGVDDVWLWEDCFLGGGISTSAAALAWSTEVRIGLGLMPVPFRNPALAAMEVAAVARMFPGRFVPAIGHGVLDWMGQTGVRAASPLTLLRENTTAIRALLHGDRVTTDGRYVHLDDVGLDWPPADVPPLLLGARGDKTLALAGGRLADGIVLDDGDDVHRDLSGERLARSLGIALEGRAGSALAGQPFQVVAYVGLGDRDPAERARELVAAGATTLAFCPDGDAPDPAEPLAAVTAARAALAG